MVDNENMCKVITSGYCLYADGVDEDVKSCADCPWYNPEAEQRFFEEVTRMADREKVKKGLDLCLTGEPSTCKDCPYDAECKEARGIGPSPLRRDALELLKEQEAVEPEAEILNEIDRIYRCPNCHKALFYQGQKYCDDCGKAVKWE